MTQTKRNLLANLISNAWLLLVALASVPFYIRLMGAESYGLIGGVFPALQAFCVPLDLGLSTTFNRELARLSATPDGHREMRDLLCTLERVFLGTAAVIAVLVAASSPLVAGHWLNLAQLTVAETTAALALMGVALAVQWPLGLYSAGMLGLGRQVGLARVNIIMYAVRFGGVLAALWLVEPSVRVFFAWQIVTTAIHTLWMRSMLGRSLPAAARRPVADWGMIRKHRYFAAGNTGISVSVVALMQIDSVILSRIVTLDVLGYYSLAKIIASTLSRAAAPLFATLFPRLTQLHRQEDWGELTVLYHRGCQFLSAIILPGVAVLVLFARQILEVFQPWTKLPALADNTAVALALLAVGTAANALTTVPFAVQLAYGWTKLSVFANLLAAAALALALAPLAWRWGPTGAAGAWLIANLLLLSVYVPCMHRRILQSEGRRWLLHDVVSPLAAATAAALVVRLAMPAGEPGLAANIVALGVAALAALVAGAMATTVTRQWTLRLILPWRRRQAPS